MKLWSLLLVLLVHTLSSYYISEAIPLNSTEILFTTEVAPEPTTTIRRTDQILCLILIPFSRERNFRMFEVTKKLWGYKCDQVVYAGTYFMNEVTKEEIHLKLRKNPGYGGTMEALEYVYDNMATYDWVLVATDGTLVRMHHLRDFIAQQDQTNKPVHFGYKEYCTKKEFFTSYITYKKEIPTFTMRAGYVINAAALLELVTKCHIPDYPQATFPSSEDIYIGECLKEIGSKMLNTRDEIGREKFHNKSLDEVIKNFQNTDHKSDLTRDELICYYGHNAITFYTDNIPEMKRMDTILTANKSAPAVALAPNFSAASYNYCLYVLLVTFLMKNVL